MKLRATLLFAALALLTTSPTLASTSTCQGAGDGTACVTTCISSGICMMNNCVPVTLRPDGTACSTDNRCTAGDTCLAGECVAGAPVVCPDLNACFIGFCSPQFGCSLRNVCRPDMAMNPPADMATTPSDMSVEVDQGVPTDLGEQPDLTGVPNDMCFIPVGAEFYTCTGEDGFYYIPFDAAMPTDAAINDFHVRGSRIGDCSFGAGAVPAPWLVGFLFAALALFRFRSRRA